MAGKSAFAKALDAFGKKNFEEAVDLFDEAVDSEPKNVAYLLKRAECHLKLESYAEAVADATLALKLQPTNTEAHYRKVCDGFTSGHGAAVSTRLALYSTCNAGHRVLPLGGTPNRAG
jgi:tetratricopeptide (TPR) repeat protein